MGTARNEVSGFGWKSSARSNNHICRRVGRWRASGSCARHRFQPGGPDALEDQFILPQAGLESHLQRRAQADRRSGFHAPELSPRELATRVTDAERKHPSIARSRHTKHRRVPYHAAEMVLEVSARWRTCQSKDATTIAQLTTEPSAGHR
jgi:hypothetical protein